MQTYDFKMLSEDLLFFVFISLESFYLWFIHSYVLEKNNMLNSLEYKKNKFFVGFLGIYNMVGITLAVLFPEVFLYFIISLFSLFFLVFVCIATFIE